MAGKLGHLVLCIAMLSVLLGVASAANCTDITSWWRFNSTLTDDCGTNHLTAQDGASVYVPGQFNMSWEGNNARWARNNTAANIPNGNRTTCLWVRAYTSPGNFERAYEEVNIGGQITTDYGYTALNTFTFTHRDAAGNNVQLNRVFNVGDLAHFCVVYNTTADTMYLFENGTFINSNTNVAMGALDTPDMVLIGERLTSLGGQQNRHWNGTIDELVVFDKVLKQAEITLWYNNGSWNGSAPAPACPAPTITPLWPADNYHTNQASITYNYTLTYYTCNALTNTSFVANGTEKVYNASALVNGTNAFAWAFDGGNALYQYNVRASNSTMDFNGTTRNIYYDISNPVITATLPTANQSFYFGDSNNLNAACNDQYAFNFSADVFSPVLAPLAEYNNDTGTPPTFTLTNEFTSALPVANNYLINFTCVDSHTNNIDDGSIGYTDKNDLILRGNDGKIKGHLKNNNSNLVTVNVDKLTDRQKITYNFNTTIKKFVETLTSDTCGLTIVNSGIPGHIVFCDRWYDAAAAVKQGWTVKTKQLKNNTVEITYLSAGLKSIDPATGGLNTGFLVRNFSIIPDSTITTGTSSFFVGSEGYITANYDNVTDGALITGADCAYNVTDPIGGLTNSNMGELALFYRGNFTPSLSGSHSYTVICNKSGWVTQAAAGTFNVLGAAPDFVINLEVQSGDETTRTYCSGNDRMVQKNKTACIENECAITSVTYSVACEHGCYRGECQAAPENYTVLLIIVALVLLLILIALGLAR